MVQLSLNIVQYAEATTSIHMIRSTVFQQEQGVDPALEFDGLDDSATHILACVDCHPIGTARIRCLNSNLAKIERVAVLADYRGQGIGKRIMAVAIAWLEDRGMPEVKINAQVHAKAFYDKLGFLQRGDEFDEAGIPHIEMRKRLSVATALVRD